MRGAAAEPFEHDAMPATVPLGRLRFDPDALVLYDGAEVVPLPPLCAQVLGELVHAAGDVIPAAALRASLWGDAAVEERNLNQQIYVLRKALRRDALVRIENVPRRGYRLVVAAVALQRRTSSRFGWVAAAVAVGFAIAAGLAGTPTTPQPIPTALARNLALANYLQTSEGAAHLQDAARYYRAVVSADPEQAQGYGGLALVDAKLALGAVGNDRFVSFASARVEAAKALHLDAHQSDALTALGIVASVADRRDDMAKRFFDAAVASDPAAESPRAWRGKFRLSVGDFRGAGCDFKTVSFDNPTSGSAVGVYGEWLVLDRDYLQASAVLSQALDLGYHPGFTRYWLARAYHGRGLDAQALRLSNEVLALYPGEPSALTLRLRVEASLGQHQAMRDDLARIERIRNPKNIDPIALASADVAVGERTQALVTLQHYEASDHIGLDDLARIRTDPDFDTLRTGFNTMVTL